MKLITPFALWYVRGVLGDSQWKRNATSCTEWARILNDVRSGNVQGEMAKKAESVGVVLFLSDFWQTIPVSMKLIPQKLSTKKQWWQPAMGPGAGFQKLSKMAKKYAVYGRWDACGGS